MAAYKGSAFFAAGQYFIAWINCNLSIHTTFVFQVFGYCK